MLVIKDGLSLSLCSQPSQSLNVSCECLKYTPAKNGLLTVYTALTVSLKAASYKSPLIKKLQLFVSGGTVRPGSTETLSDPTPSVAKVLASSVMHIRSYIYTMYTDCAQGEYTLCESVCSGPVLEPGPDHSLKRKSDYTTLHNSQ